jgi:hypothetical protein
MGVVVADAPLKLGLVSPNLYFVVCVVVSFARSEFLSARPFFYCVLLWVARWPAPPLASLGGGSSAG